MGTPASSGRIGRLLNGVSKVTGIKKPDLVRGGIGVGPGVVSFVINYGGEKSMGLPPAPAVPEPLPAVPVMHVPAPPAPPKLPAPPGAPPLPPHVGGGTFTVQPGDNLYNIAKERYGNPNLWPLIQAANPDIGPDSVIFPGQVLHIPELRTPPANSVAQVVQPGDTVWAIANGDEALIQQIAEINHINPAEIFPGQVLIVPPAA
jgi:nucleoid-associated protein YgaU